MYLFALKMRNGYPILIYVVPTRILCTSIKSTSMRRTSENEDIFLYYIARVYEYLS